MNKDKLDKLDKDYRYPGLLPSEIKELIDTVRQQKKEISRLRMESAAGQYWYERSQEPLLEVGTKYAGLLSLLFTFKRLEIYLHILPNKRYWKMWGYHEDWYDGPHPGFHLGPFFMIFWEEPHWGNPKEVGEFNEKYYTEH